MEKATIIVDVDQPLVQNNKTQTITNPSETITINPDEGYDALKKVTVTTNIPLQNNKTQTITNPNETVTINPDTGYEALKKVTVITNVPIPELETWNNKRFISTGTINVGNVMNDNTKAGISKESTFVIDVPTPSITQISNYPVTTTGTVNVPIPSGYDAVDSISLSVNIPNVITLNKFKIYGTVYSFSQMSRGVTSVTLNDRQTLFRINYSSYSPALYELRMIKNYTGISQTVSLNASEYYYIATSYRDNYVYLVDDSNKNVISICDWNSGDTDFNYTVLYKKYFVLNGITA